MFNLIRIRHQFPLSWTEFWKFFPIPDSVQQCFFGKITNFRPKTEYETLLDRQAGNTVYRHYRKVSTVDPPFSSDMPRIFPEACQHGRNRFIQKRLIKFVTKP